MLEDDPSILSNIEELKTLAAHLQIDEIHIFDDTGCIISGTIPEYYGLTFDSGEQVRFFLPLLTDKSLQLVQEVTANTAVGEQMQYSASFQPLSEFFSYVCC